MAQDGGTKGQEVSRRNGSRSLQRNSGLDYGTQYVVVVVVCSSISMPERT